MPIKRQFNRHNMVMPTSAASTRQPLYVQIAQDLVALIETRVLQPGQKLPSIRDIAAHRGVSVATAVQALRWLEERHIVQASPRSGYFVCADARAPALPGTSRPPKQSMVVHHSSRVERLSLPAERLRASFGSASPEDPLFFDEGRIRTAMQQALRKHRHTLIEYSGPSGTPPLRSAIAQRALHLGCQLEPEDIIVTGSCIHSVSLCLRAVTQPGDIVALESPTHFGFLDLLESLKLRALEIPTHPQSGMSLPALQLALDTQPIKAVLAVPTLSNPLGAIMSSEDKRALVHLLAERQTPLIEDVVLNDLLGTDERRRAAKSFDTGGHVMVCGSFSKTLCPGIRIGWLQAGRWHDKVQRLRQTEGIATNVVLEHTLADLSTQVGYEARMRKFGSSLHKRLQQARALIAQSFPAGTRISDPPTGLTLWLELPPRIETLALFELCQQEGILFAPGSLFTASNRFGHCLRLSFAGPWGPEQKQALVRIGTLAKSI